MATWHRPASKRTTGLWGAETVYTARNRRALRRTERRFPDPGRQKEKQRAARDARREGERQRRAAYWGFAPRKRALLGELIEDTAGAVWSALWRRGS